MGNFIEEENRSVNDYFNLKEILAFQTVHDVQIVRFEDFNYACIIDGKVYMSALTPMFALTFGVFTYKLKHDEHKEDAETILA
jgi:hypothetical protein